MPIYEFRCPACDHHFEEMVDYGKTAPCSECSHAETRRKISLFGAPRPRLGLVDGGGASAGPQGDGPVGFHFGPNASGSVLVGCSSSGHAVGMQIAEGAEIETYGYRSTGDGVGIENEGTLVDTDTVIT